MFLFRGAQLNRIEAMLTEILKIMSTVIDPNLQALMAQVAQNTSVEASAVTLIQGIAAQLQSALNNSDSSALPALVTQLNSSATALAAAVAANTPTASPSAAKAP